MVILTKRTAEMKKPQQYILPGLLGYYQINN